MRNMYDTAVSNFFRGSQNDKQDRINENEEECVEIDALINDLGNIICDDIALSAMYELVEIGKPAVKPLIDKLGGSDIVHQIAIKNTLVKIGKPAVELLIVALNDSNPRIREGVADVLGELEVLQAVDPLKNILKDRDPYVRDSVATALKKLGVKEKREKEMGGKQYFSVNIPFKKGQEFGFISKLEWELLKKGITFDTGSDFNSRDWELDFSLKGATPTEVITFLKDNGIKFTAKKVDTLE